MRKRLLLLPCILILSAFTFSACGGGGDDEGEIKDAIETSATSDDPGDCTKLATQHFVEQTVQSTGSEAVKSCEREASEDSGADSVTVSEIEVDGSKATANVALAGGGLDGQEVEVALIRQGDQWKLDEITGFAKFNEAKVIEGIEKGFGPSSQGKRLANCIITALEEAPQAKFEKALLSISTDGLEELAADCL